jgi:hypothetical protein
MWNRHGSNYNASSRTRHNEGTVFWRLKSGSRSVYSIRSEKHQLARLVANPIMYGVPAFLIFLGFAIFSMFLVLVIFLIWRNRHGEKAERGSVLLSVFLLLWLTLVSSVYGREALFHYQLRSLNASDVVSVQIGRHNFTDPATITEIVGALRRSRWFQSNHGGWGDSIPMILSRRSEKSMTLDVALYFRVPAAIIGPATRRGLGNSVTQRFAPELLTVLERHGVKLPDCDTAYRRPCTPEQLDP